MEIRHPKHPDRVRCTPCCLIAKPETRKLDRIPKAPTRASLANPLWDCPTRNKLGTDLIPINSQFASLRSVGIRWINELHSPRFRQLIQPRVSPCVHKESQRVYLPKRKSTHDWWHVDSIHRIDVALRMPQKPALPRFFQLADI